MSVQLDAIINALGSDVRPSGNYYLAKCPCHGGTKHSVQISDGDKGRVRITCHSHNCDPMCIMESIGLNLSDLFYEPLSPNYQPTYNKKAEAKKVLYEVQVLALALNDVMKDRQVDGNRAITSIDAIKNAGKIFL